MTLQSLLKLLSEARRKADTSRASMNAIVEKAKRDSIYAIHSVALTQALAEVDMYEKQIREEAARLYQEKREKQPHPAVKVILKTKLQYVPEIALEWCKQNLTPAVIPESLDVKTFEKLAKEVKPEFVTIVEEPQAQIAQDLSKFDFSFVPDDNLPGTKEAEMPF